MAAVVAAIDSLAESHFSDMNSRVCRDALKELVKVAGSGDAAITKEVGKLDQKQQDTLMKIVYVGLSSDPTNSAAFLKWHAILFEKSGAGAIVRTLTDKSNPVPAPKGP